MTHHTQSNALDQIGELLAEQGFDGMTQVLTLLLNEVMKLERAQALGAGPYERSEGRQGHANGFKPKTVLTRMGPITLAVPPWRRASAASEPFLRRGFSLDIPLSHNGSERSARDEPAQHQDRHP